MSSPDKVVNLDLYADLDNRVLVSSDGSPITALAPVVLGDTLLCRLRAGTRDNADTWTLTDLPVRSIKASLGNIMAAPVAGTFTVSYGILPASAPIAFNASAQDVAAALTGALPSSIAEIQAPAPSCWLFRLADNSVVEITAGTNRLDPPAFVRARSFVQHGSENWHEIRLIQTPLAWNEDGYERVLPDPPSIRETQRGDAGSDVTPPVNEVQALTVPPDFAGTYKLTFDYRPSAVLGPQDGPDEIATALNGLWSDGGVRFAVTNPEPNNAYIEFVNTLGGAPQPLIAITVNTFPPGVLTFRMRLDRAELQTALRPVAFLDLQFSVEVELGDPAHPETPGRPLTLFVQTLRVLQPEIYPELAATPNIHWLNPPSPRDYIPFTPDQIITGIQTYVATFGDGESTEFLFAHNLNTDALHCTVRQNRAGGRLLVLGTEYTVTLSDANSLALHCVGSIPDANALAISISTAGPVSAFQAHTHTVQQIIGLEDALASLSARMANLETLLPTGTLANRPPAGAQVTITIPDRSEIFPGRLPPDFDSSKLNSGTSIAGSRPGALLPAIHATAPIDYSLANLPSAPSPGTVYRNTGISALLIPGGGGRRGTACLPGGFFGFDGRYLYALNEAGASKSYFPADFERELFLLHVNDAQWQPGGQIELDFELDLQTANANSRIQWLVVIEAGNATEDLVPAPTADNLALITWAAAPLCVQRVIVSEVRVTHHFGALLKRAADNTITAERLNYTAWTAAPLNSLPGTPAVILRARLIQFDTEDNVSGATGFLYYQLSKAKVLIS